MSKVGSHLNVTDTKKKRDKTQTVNIGKGIGTLLQIKQMLKSNKILQITLYQQIDNLNKMYTFKAKDNLIN